LVNDYIRLKTSKKSDITAEFGKKYRIKLSGNAKDDSALLELTIFRRLVDRIEQIGGLHITGALGFGHCRRFYGSTGKTY
jgi:hypothetical protein